MFVFFLLLTACVFVASCLQAGCPIAPGAAFNYTVQLAVLQEYPTLSKVIVKWEVKDQTGGDFFCWEVAASISN